MAVFTAEEITRLALEDKAKPVSEKSREQHDNRPLVPAKAVEQVVGVRIE